VAKIENVRWFMRVGEILRNEEDDFILLRVDDTPLLFTYSDIRRAAKLATSVDKNREKASENETPD
jgi:hypothetical protein